MASVGVFCHLAHSAESLAALGTVPGNSYCFSAPAKVERPAAEDRLQRLTDLRAAVFASVPRCAAAVAAAPLRSRALGAPPPSSSGVNAHENLNNNWKNI